MRPVSRNARHLRGIASHACVIAGFPNIDIFKRSGYARISQRHTFEFRYENEMFNEEVRLMTKGSSRCRSSRPIRHVFGATVRSVLGLRLADSIRRDAIARRLESSTKC